MDYSSSRPGSPGGSGTSTPLQPLSHNQQRDTSSLFTSGRRVHQEDARDSSVHDKINQFNSLAMQSKQLERKTADAALKRAMLGREEAESEMRRYREEARQLRKQVDEGKERERRVGERLETVMVCYLGTGSCDERIATDTPPFLGELRTRKGNACPHAGTVGEGNPTCQERDLQGAERTGKAPGRAQVLPGSTKAGGGGA